MAIFKNWIFWVVYALVPALLTLAMGFQRQTMVYLYVAACLLAVGIWWYADRATPKAKDDF